MSFIHIVHCGLTLNYTDFYLYPLWNLLSLESQYLPAPKAKMDLLQALSYLRSLLLSDTINHIPL